MRQFIIENQGIQTFLVYHLNQNDIVDEVSYRIVHDNQISGILPTFMAESEGERCLKFNISSRISLEQFFNGMVNRARFLSVFSSIINTLQEGNAYFLKETHFFLDSHQIYVNVGTKEAEMLYVPIMQNTDSCDIITFLKNLVFQTQFDPSENTSYIAKVIQYLDCEEQFTIKGLKDMLDEIIEEDEPALKVFQEGRARMRSMNLKHTAQPEPVQSDWEGPMQGIFGRKQEEFAETTVLSTDMQRKEESSVFIEGVVKKKKKRTIRSLFADKWNKKQDNGKEAALVENQAEAEEEELPVSFLDKERADVLEDEKPLFIQAYLTRVKTREHIVIDKQVYKIGKERSFVDYCVIDNPTISRSHANIVMYHDEYYIVDMNSKNHTYVNGRMIHSGDKVKLIHGSRIKLSNEEFEFYLQS